MSEIRPRDALFDEWWREPQNLADLWCFLVEEGEAPSDPAYYMEKPWKYEPEWERMKQTMRATGTGF